MIKGLGTDIAEVSRVNKVYDNTGEAFVDRILNKIEQQGRPKNPDMLGAFLAKRFAAKEAAAKALGTGISDGISFLDFTISHTELGAPILIVSGRAAEIAKEKGISSWHLSISDEKHYAMATVIVEG